MEKTLYQSYGSDPTKINPNQTVDERFALPGFADAAAKAGYTKDTYKINMQNEEANNKISGFLNENPPKSQLVVTAGPAVQQGMKDTTDLMNLLGTGQGQGTTGTETPKPSATNTGDAAYSDAYTTALDNLSSTSSLATKNLTAGIQADYQNSVNEAMKNADSYKRGLQLLGIQHNEATFSPDILAAHITDAGNKVAAKLDDLKRNKDTALIDAEKAKETGDLSTLKEKMDYVRKLKDDEVNVLKQARDSMVQSKDIADIQAHDIYDVLDTVKNPQDKQTVIEAVARKYGIPVLSLVTALADEKSKRQTGALDLQNKQRLASGGGSVTAKEAFQKITPQLKAKTGADGYMAPEDYMRARDNFRAITGGTFAQFDSEYKDLVNPASYAKVGIKSTDDLAAQIKAAFPDQ